MNNLAWTITGLAGALALVFFGMFIYFIIEIVKGRKGRKITLKDCIGFLFSVFVLGVTFYCLYNLPEILRQNLSWYMVEILGPISLKYVAIAVGAFFLFFYLCCIVLHVMEKEKKIEQFMVLGGFAIINGLTNTFIVFIINQGIRRGYEEADGLIIYFLIVLFVRVVGIKILRSIVITTANNLIYEKRIFIISKILNAPHFKLEKISKGKVEAGLNNDTESVSNVVSLLVNMLTSVTTLIFSFIYLGMLSMAGLLISLITILIACSIFYYFSAQAREMMVKARDLQNTFFKYIFDLLEGHKSLVLNSKKREEFGSDMSQVCEEYKDNRLEASKKFINVFIIGEILTMMIIGSVLFVLPKVVADVGNDNIRDYVFVFMYMSGPVRVVLNNLQQFMRFRISWGRINELVNELTEVSMENEITKNVNMEFIEGKLNISLKGIKYSYVSEKNEMFTLGPVDCEFNSNEITYITGGNGSGKTTLGKILTGLYAPDEGEVTINGEKKNFWELGECFSNVFADYHLFKKLYGIDLENKDEIIKKYMEVLRVEEKVKIENGELSTIKLSSGQKKRLALLIAYLEDKPVYFFDEWASDQDPGFRKFFYETLLPDLRNRGKCVIAITHDDRYFHLADKVIKMEMGEIANREELKVG